MHCTCGSCERIVIVAPADELASRLSLFTLAESFHTFHALLEAVKGGAPPGPAGGTSTTEDPGTDGGAAMALLLLLLLLLALTDISNSRPACT
jgi:hypothetical protein